MAAGPAADGRSLPGLPWRGSEVDRVQPFQFTNEEVKALFTTLVAGVEVALSNAEFDGALLEQLGLSLSHFVLRKLPLLTALICLS